MVLGEKNSLARESPLMSGYSKRKSSSEKEMRLTLTEQSKIKICMDSGDLRVACGASNSTALAARPAS